MLERLAAAMNAHDAEAMASLFAEDYRSVQPAHPGRDFTGSAQVLANWSAVFAGVPDLTATLVSSSVQGRTEWGEWWWEGHHLDGSDFAMAGVIVLTVAQNRTEDQTDDRIAEARLFMEPVETGEDIDSAVTDLYSGER